MRRLNGWQRIGVVLSASWFMLMTTFFGAICGRSLLETNFAALWGVETATARAQRPSSLPSSDDSFNGMFDDLIPQARQRSEPTRAIDWNEMIRQHAPPLQPEPQRAPIANPYDRLPDIATGSVKSTTGAYDDLIPKKGMSLKELQETGFWYFVLTAAPIAILWALGYTIAWIVAGFRTDRREAGT